MLANGYGAQLPPTSLACSAAAGAPDAKMPPCCGSRALLAVSGRALLGDNALIGKQMIELLSACHRPRLQPKALHFTRRIKISSPLAMPTYSYPSFASLLISSVMM